MPQDLKDSFVPLAASEERLEFGVWGLRVLLCFTRALVFIPPVLRKFGLSPES